MELKPGDRLGKYTVERKLTSGGMADLYVAVGTGAAGFEKRLLLKVLRPELAGRRKFVDLLADEARICGRLEHECIVRTFDFAEAEGRRFLVMEYVQGMDLARVLDAMDARDERVPPRIAAYVAMQVARGLAYAHGASANGRPLDIVHRDINPHNLMVSVSGEVKILDFGIAKARSRVSRTEFGELKGKVLYMAPEQAGGREVDARTDLYALGMVLYEMVTGVPILTGGSDVEIIEAARRPTFLPPAELVPDIDPALERIVLRCLAPEPERRYAAAAELEDDLFRYLSESGEAIRPRDLADWIAELNPDAGADPEPTRRTAVLAGAGAAPSREQAGQLSWPAGRAPGSVERSRRPGVAVLIALLLAGIIAAAAVSFLLESTPPPEPAAVNSWRLPDTVPPDHAVVQTTPPGTLVFRGEEFAARSPAPVRADEGPVTVVARLAGRRDFTGRANAKSKRSSLLTPTLPVAYATVLVQGLPEGAVVFVDGREAEAEDGQMSVPAGLRRLAVQPAGGGAGDEILMRLAPGGNAAWRPVQFSEP